MSQIFSVSIWNLRHEAPEFIRKIRGHSHEVDPTQFANSKCKVGQCRDMCQVECSKMDIASKKVGLFPFEQDEIVDVKRCKLLRDIHGKKTVTVTSGAVWVRKEPQALESQRKHYLRHIHGVGSTNGSAILRNSKEVCSVYRNRSTRTPD